MTGSRLIVNNSLDSLRRTKETVPLDEIIDIPDQQEDNREAELNLQVAEVKKAMEAVANQGKAKK